MAYLTLEGEYCLSLQLAPIKTIQTQILLILGCSETPQAFQSLHTVYHISSSRSPRPSQASFQQPCVCQNLKQGIIRALESERVYLAFACVFWMNPICHRLVFHHMLYNLFLVVCGIMCEHVCQHELVCIPCMQGSVQVRREC